MNRHPKEEPCKRYLYEKNGGPVPYKTVKSRPPRKVRRKMTWTDRRFGMLAAALRTIRFAKRGQTDQEIDDYLVGLVRSRCIGFGF